MLPITRSFMRRDWLMDIIGLAAFFALFYLLWLNSYPLFTPDEGRYSEVAREMVATGDYITPRVNGVAFLDKPILYYWLQAAAIHLFGVKEWALRFFPVLAGILGCLMTYICGRQLFNRRTGLISALVLGTSPLYFGLAHYANLDLEVAVFVSCTLLCFITAVQREGVIRSNFLFAAYFFSALAVLTKGLIGIAFPSMIAGAWILLLGRWTLLKKIRLPAGLMIFLVMVLPWYSLVQKANPEFLHYFFVNQQITRFLSAGEFNNKTPFWFYLPIVLIGFFPWTIFLAQALYNQCRKAWQAPQQHGTELFLLLWVVIIFLFFSIPRSKIIGYILPIFPALALLVGNYLSMVWENTQRKSILRATSMFIILSGLLAALLVGLPYVDWTDLPVAVSPYFMIMAAILIASAGILYFLRKKGRFFALFITCIACNIGVLLTLTSSAAHLNQNSAKPLVSHLNAIIRPQDEVVTYYKFYQDVPLYLGRRVTIVADWHSPEIPYRDNWLRELWYGMAFQKTDDWLIDDTTFWQRYRSDRRMFVFLNENYFSQFKSQAKRYFILERYNDIILLSNKPEVLSKNP